MTPTGDDEITCCARVQFEHGQCVRTRIGKAELTPVDPRQSPRLRSRPPRWCLDPPTCPRKRSVSPPRARALSLRQIPSASSVSPGETITYEYEIKNVGTAPAKEVVVEATPAEGLLS